MKRTWYLLVLVVLLAGLIGPTTLAQGPEVKPPEPTQPVVGPSTGTAPQKQLQEPPVEGAGPLALWPGPDGYQYNGSDCTYNWVDITASGTPVPGLTDDSFAGPFNIGFTFPFYDTTFTAFYVSSNGFVSFGAGSSTLSNQCPLPNNTTPNNLVALMWDDLYPNYTTGGVYYQSFPNCPVGGGACVIVEYYNWAHCCSPSNLSGTWEAILFDNGSVRIQYLDTGSELGSSSTEGVEGNNAAADYGLTYACDTANSVVDNTCIQMQRFQGPAFTTSFKAGPALGQPGGRLTYDVAMINSGTADAPNTTMVDPIPVGTTFFQVISPPELVYNPALDQMEWLGTVPQGETINAIFEVDVDADIPCPATITNTAVITAPGALAEVTVQATTGIWGAFYYASNFEPDDGGLVDGGAASSWAWGTPTSGPNSAHSGNRVWATNLAGNYNMSENSFIESPVVDLSPAFYDPTDPLLLEWWQWLQTESGYDYASLEVRAGGSDWTALYGPIDGAVDLTWTRHEVDISDYIGYPDFQFRFHFTSDGSVAYPGWYVDDVSVHQCTPPQPGLYLGPNVLTVSGCNGVTQTHMLGLYNNTGADGTFAMTYALADPRFGTISGPASIPLNQGQSTSLQVTLVPAMCLPPNLDLVATVTAEGNGYADTSIISKTIVSGGNWTQIATEPNNGRMDNVLGAWDNKAWSITGYGADANVRTYDPATNSWTVVGTPPPFGSNYARSGCQFNDVVVMYGDAGTTGFTGLWAYDMGAGVWTNLAPTGTPPAQTGIWAPAWAADPETGYCYMTGGATTPGAGNLTTVYVYDPGGNAWLAPLPNFTSIRDFHAAFIFRRPADSHKLLCVVGGNNAAGMTSTQCYDMDLGVWNAEDADLGALPADMWGTGYAVKVHGGTQPQLWLTGGVVAGSLSAATTYYDVNAGTWNSGGNLVSAAIYRTAAVALNNEIYHLGGSTGSFSYTGLADRHVQCPVCNQPPGWLQGQVLDSETGDVDPTCTDAVVHIMPGNLDVPVDPGTGAYGPVALFPWDYAVSASAPGYSVETFQVVITEGMTLTQDFNLWRPVIEVAPTSIYITAPVSIPLVFPLYITNSGHLPLAFEIREVPPGRLDRAATPGRQTPAATGIDPYISEQMISAADGQVDFFVAFWDTADLSGAAAFTNKAAKVEFVRSALRTAADTAQARVRQWLDGQGITYKVFYIDNTLLVHGNQALLNALSAFPEISGFWGNHINQLMPIQTSTAVGPQAIIPWDISIMQIDRVWNELGITGEGVIVANLDTGVDYQHEALFPNYLCGNGPHTDCWLDPDGGTTAPNDNNGHGTGTMSQMAADNDPAFQYSVGGAPDAGWIACLGCPGGSCPDTALNACFDWVVMTTPNTPDIVNNSWGTWSAICTYNYQGKLQALRAANILPVFAAGNIGNACNTSTPPANNPEAFAVGATTPADDQASFSSTGPGLCAGKLQFPEISAPGDATCAAVAGGGYACNFGGTSFAAPRAAGCLALMKSANPNLTINEMEDVLMATADNKPNSDCGTPQDDPNYRYGDGRVNCFAAVSAVYNADIPWVWEDPITGTIPPTETQIVDLTFQCTITDVGQVLTGTLRVTHNDPCTGPVDIPLQFACMPPCEPVQILDVTTAISGCVVTFTGELTGAVDFSYEWDFGAFGTSTDPMPVVDFGVSGTYPYTLTAYNCYGTAVDVFTGTVTVECVQPCVPVDLITVTTAISGCVVDFGTDLTGDPPITYAWDFGALGTSTEPTPTVNFGVDGTYPYTLTVTNCDGTATDTLTGEVTVACIVPCVPVDLITFTTVISGCVVDFGAQLTGDLPIVYAWDFGALGTSTEPTPTVDFGLDGTYSYTLTVTNCGGTATDTLADTVTVTCIVPPPRYFIYLPLLFKAGTP